MHGSSNRFVRQRNACSSVPVAEAGVSAISRASPSAIARRGAVDVGEWWSSFFAAPAWQDVQLVWDTLEGEGSAGQADKIDPARGLRENNLVGFLAEWEPTRRLALVVLG